MGNTIKFDQFSFRIKKIKRNITQCDSYEEFSVIQDAINAIKDEVYLDDKADDLAMWRFELIGDLNDLWGECQKKIQANFDTRLSSLRRGIAYVRKTLCDEEPNLRLIKT